MNGNGGGIIPTTIFYINFIGEYTMDDFILTPTNTIDIPGFSSLLDDIEPTNTPMGIEDIANAELYESYYSSGIKFAIDSDRHFNDLKKTLYVAISESKNETMVLESFNDFFAGVHDIIMKVIKFIQSIAERFLTALMKFINSEKYLVKHKKDFDSFKSSDEFKFMGFNYTFNDYIPSTQAITDTADFFSDLSGIGELNLIQVRGVNNAINFEDAYDNFRGSILNTTPISASEYDEELFKIYRDGEMDTKELDADRAVIMKSKDRFFSYSKTKNKVESDVRSVRTSYNELEKRIKDVVGNYGGINVAAFNSIMPTTSYAVPASIPADVQNALNIYMKNKCTELQEFTNIHILAFTAKLDAMSECYKQDKNILYTALSRIQRTDSARRE